MNEQHELIEAAKEMLEMFENLCDRIPWGDTFGIDFQALNEAPIKLRQAILKAEGKQA